MRSNKFSIGLNVRLAVLVMTMVMTATCATAQGKVLHNFGNGKDGKSPDASLIFDAAGNLYGTTAAGGVHGYGTVFELIPNAGRGWSEKILHNFNNDNGGDGETPEASLVFDSAGNLYGTTFSGGTYGYGTVFELTPEVAGRWTEKILHNFNNNGSDGYWPYYANLIIDVSGNLFGTTSRGGAGSGGTVFELTPVVGGGTWTETVLHGFNVDGGGGSYPEAGLIFDSAGNLYGTTYEGGTDTYGGTVFELSPDADGDWTETVLFNCNIKDGWGPRAGLIFDSTGNLYGTTQYLGIATGGGTAFELTPNADGTWTNRVLQNFYSNGKGGSFPSGLILDAAGSLYGTASNGGAYSSGVAFELSPRKRGGSESILLNFNGKDGYGPAAGLVLDSNGRLYGTASAGGAYGGGVVFEIAP